MQNKLQLEINNFNKSENDDIILFDSIQVSTYSYHQTTTKDKKRNDESCFTLGSTLL